MTSEEVLNFQNICRICMSSSELRSLFTQSKKKFINVSTLCDMVVECTSLCVSENDNLPQNICQKCVYTVNQFFKFKQKAKQTDTKLRDYTLKNNHHRIPSLNFTEFDSEEKGVIKNELCALEELLEPCSSNFVNVFDEIDVQVKEEENTFEIDDNAKDTNVINGKLPKILNKQRKKVLKIGKKIKSKTTSSKSTIIQFNAEGNKKSKSIHQCDICGKRLYDRSNLNKHKKLHTDERPYPCDFCGKLFRRAEHVRTHRRIHTGEKPFKCNQCDRAFTQRSTLICHIRTHTGERPEICTICGKSFSQAITLTYHMRTHTGETPFKCKICSKGFTHAGNLNIHMRFHSGEKPHECTICHQRFFTRSHLNVHIKNHRGEKNHVCNICSKAFLRKEHLRDHILTHTGARPHQCLICPKKYTQKSHLRRHMKTHAQNLVKK